MRGVTKRKNVPVFLGLEEIGDVIERCLRWQVDGVERSVRILEVSAESVDSFQDFLLNIFIFIDEDDVDGTMTSATINLGKYRVLVFIGFNGADNIQKNNFQSVPRLIAHLVQSRTNRNRPDSFSSDTVFGIRQVDNNFCELLFSSLAQASS